jgi:hypothetical protein
MSVEDALALIHDLYDASPENRRFLHARFGTAQAALEWYRAQVSRAVFPDPLTRQPVRVGEAHRLVRHFRAATRDVAGVADLLLTLVEEGTAQALDLGYGDERYFDSLVRALRQLQADWKRIPAADRGRAIDRLRRLDHAAAGCGYGFGDCIHQCLSTLEAWQRRQQI